MSNNQCNVQSGCKGCTLLGECPNDRMRCEGCGETIEEGAGIEMENEEGVIYTVCPECYANYLLDSYDEEEF